MDHGLSKYLIVEYGAFGGWGIESCQYLGTIDKVKERLKRLNECNKENDRYGVSYKVFMLTEIELEGDQG